MPADSELDLDWNWMTLPTDEFLRYMREKYGIDSETDDTGD